MAKVELDLGEDWEVQPLATLTGAPRFRVRHVPSNVVAEGHLLTEVQYLAAMATRHAEAIIAARLRELKEVVEEILWQRCMAL